MSSPVPETDVVRPVPRRTNDSANFANQNWRHYDQEYPKGLNLTQTKKELDRLKAYGLDIVGDDDLATELLTDKTSPFFGTSKSRRLKNKALLPYKTETIRDQYKYLSHIIAHIYIAVKSSDLKGNLSVSVEDLESAREIIANNKDQEAYINSINSRPSYGAQFETLHTENWVWIGVHNCFKILDKRTEKLIEDGFGPSTRNHEEADQGFLRNLPI